MKTTLYFLIHRNILRPGDPYGCSTIMSGTEGQTTLTFSNRDSPLQLDLPGIMLNIIDSTKVIAFF